MAGGLRRVARLIDHPPRFPSMNHQLSAYSVLSRYMSFDGKDIVEVGGAQSCESMLPFVKHGAASGTVTAVITSGRNKLARSKTFA